MKNKNLQNPFAFGGAVTGDDFCGRELELAELKADAFSGQNVLVYASRRYGRASLLRFFGERCRADGVKCMYVDASRALDVAGFVDEYFNAFARELGGVERVIRSIKNKLGFGLSFSIRSDGEAGDLTYNLDVGRRRKELSLESVVSLPFTYAKKENTLFIVIIDEFQEIAKLELEAKLRTYFQTHSRKVGYIFAGSKKSILLQMFGDEGRPFYHSVKTLPLNGIPEKDWQPFISKRFTKGGKKISSARIGQIVSLAKGCPYLVQHLCHVLWDLTGGVVKEDEIDQALSVVLAREEYNYALVWDMLSLTQRKMAIVLAEEHDALYAKDVLRAYDMVPSAAQKALSGLRAKDVANLAKGGGYVLQDPLFRLWLLRRKK